MTDVMFKKRSRGARDVRRREASPERPPSDDEAGAAVVTKKKRADAANPLVQGTAGRAASEDADARPVDRFGERSVHSQARANASTGTDTSARDDATRQADWDLEQEFAHELGRRPGGDRGSASGANDDGVYRGMGGYAKYTQERDDGSSAKFRAKGPIRAPSNVRTVTVFDYQPDICKDYKETGYCGFGDTCKFLHDRSDYLAGWQLDEAGPAASTRAGTFGEEEDDDDEEDVPFACLICRKPFKDPVVTLCGHYFCAQCAIQRYARTPKCFACGAKTNGLFNSATKILDRMNRRNQSRAEQRKERRRQHGLEDEGDDEDGEALLDGVVVG